MTRFEIRGSCLGPHDDDCDCGACPYGCPSCTENRSTCECYEHDEWDQVPNSLPSAVQPPSAAEKAATLRRLRDPNSWPERVTQLSIHADMSVAEREASTLLGDISRWLAANGVRAGDVPIDALVTIVDENITMPVFLVNGDGRRYLDPMTGLAARGTMTVPLRVSPPKSIHRWLDLCAEMAGRKLNLTGTRYTSRVGLGSRVEDLPPGDREVAEKFIDFLRGKLAVVATTGEFVPLSRLGEPGVVTARGEGVS